jgi:hypothetical protein
MLEFCSLLETLFLEMAGEVVGICLGVGVAGGGGGELVEEIGLDVKVAELAGGSADGFAGLEEASACVGGDGKELEEGFGAAEGGAQVVEGLGVRAGLAGLEGYA